ncbi:MAG TPA: hypothetical protein VGM31_15105 [Puia sp.]|jgi:hypothetical protein
MNTKSYEHRKENFMSVNKKQISLLAAGLLFVCVVHAQIKKGDILLGGNVNLSLQHAQPGGSDQVNKSTSFSLTPSIGKAVSDGLVVGLNLTYSYYKTKSNSMPVNVGIQDTYGLGVFMRKYKTLGAGFSLFGEGDLGGQYMTSNGYVEGSPKPPANKSYAITAAFYPGIAYFISRHVQLETGIQNLAYVQYRHNKSGGSPNEDRENSFDIATNLNQALQNFVVGVKWLL